MNTVDYHQIQEHLHDVWFDHMKSKVVSRIFATIERSRRIMNISVDMHLNGDQARVSHNVHGTLNAYRL